MIKKLAKIIVSLCTHISPKLGCKVIYFLKFKKLPNINKPTEFNEKLIWLKLNNYNNNPLVWKCSDKYTMRDYCINCGIEEKNLTKIIGVYERAQDINFEILPKKFALKCTHGMGFNIICEDKERLDKEKARKKLNKWLKTRFGYESAEIHYTHVKPKIICEEFIENNDNEFPIDYKIYCFNGKPEIILVCTDRKNHYKTTFYDTNWNLVHLRDSEINVDLDKPRSLEKMIKIAQKLSEDFPFVRVDFYEYKGEPIVGELTFTPAACLGEYTKEASEYLGKKICLQEFKEKEEL